MKMVEVVLTVYGDQAKRICKALGLDGMVGDITDINTKIEFEVMPAEGRWKVKITFEI